jgi:hypothetical protein
VESKAVDVRAGDLQHSFPLGRKLLGQRRSSSVSPARTIASSMTVMVPSSPARTRAGRQTRERNNVRRSALPTTLGNTRPLSPVG